MAVTSKGAIGLHATSDPDGYFGERAAATYDESTAAMSTPEVIALSGAVERLETRAFHRRQPPARLGVAEDELTTESLHTQALRSKALKVIAGI